MLHERVPEPEPEPEEPTYEVEETPPPMIEKTPTQSESTGLKAIALYDYEASEYSP